MADGGTQLAPFAGVDAPNTTPVPDVYFDVLFPHLGKAALKVLLYLTRRIFGFKREADTVSLSQICSGIRRRDGTVLDRGTGLSRHAAASAIRDLEQIGVIVATRGMSAKGDPAPTAYRLRFRESLSLSDLLNPSPAMGTGFRFPGIDSPNTTPVPDIYFDLLLPELGLAEWRVLLYVVRRTLGFKKLSDAISLDQFTDGITTHAGTVLDAGTGLSRSNVHEALNQLVMRNVLMRQRVRHERTGDGISIYSLTMRDEVREALGTTLGMQPGPLLEGTTGMPLVPGVLPGDHRGVRPANYPGVPQRNQVGVLADTYPRVPQSDYPKPMPRQGDTDGLLQGNRPGVLPGDYRGVPGRNLPASRKEPSPGNALNLPVGRLQAPQETELQDPGTQQTVSRVVTGETHETPFSSLLAQICRDLNVPDDAAEYASRVATLAETCAMAPSDFYGAVVTAWKTTRSKLDRGALEHPTAGLAYFFTVLVDRVEGRKSGSAVPSKPTSALQDSRFLELVRQRLGRLDDQTGWSHILNGLSETMTRPNLTRWFARSAAVDDREHLLVIVADLLQQQWLSTRLVALVEHEATASGELRPVRFVALQDVGAR